MKIYIYLILFLFFSCAQLYADEEIAKFDLLIGEINEANLTLKGAIKVTVEPGWHIIIKILEISVFPLLLIVRVTH
ncbi:hypothetical protein [Wolbachia endosymbiont (group A) of Sphaerophoria taeniata]|uniref:hypothetical protein n=1 Tax=Wolbachia endosymbiont (group A) of Sphaerophoria taeniata TaxID=2954057 RepID=UPI00222602BE|nr:hypothetical protein [Wolbachia endosymbiont (group A) of Sphaerophoria taeniata]